MRIASFLFFFCSCQLAFAKEPPLVLDYSKYSLAYYEDFCDLDLIRNEWNISNNNTRALSVLSEKVVDVSNCKISISVYRQPGGFLGGQIDTRKKKEFHYGLYEASIKFGNSLGAHGAFWLQSELNFPLIWGGGGVEYDIVEKVGHFDDVSIHSVHWDGYGSDHKYSSFTNRIEDGEYHKYSFVLTENYYAFYVDGLRVGSASYPISLSPLYVVFSYVVSGWGGEFYQGYENMSVDYFKYMETFDE
jgi:beta-glucanase (GH16 family)